MKRNYYEVTGKKLKKEINDWMAERQAALMQRIEFSKKVGANPKECIVFGGMGQSDSFALLFEEAPDPKLWRQPKGRNYWVPKLTTRAGKNLRKEMAAITMPGVSKVSKLIEMEEFHGCNWYSPGIHYKGDRILISPPEYYKPIRGVKRISDIQFEKLTAEKS